MRWVSADENDMIWLRIGRVILRWITGAVLFISCMVITGVILEYMWGPAPSTFQELIRQGDRHADTATGVLIMYGFIGALISQITLWFFPWPVDGRLAWLRESALVLRASAILPLTMFAVAAASVLLTTP